MRVRLRSWSRLLQSAPDSSLRTNAGSSGDVSRGVAPASPRGLSGCTLREMTGRPAGSQELLQLQQRGMDLAIREAEARRDEVTSLLASRRVVRAARDDAKVRESRLRLLEAVTYSDYPTAAMLAAARQLVACCTPWYRRPLASVVWMTPAFVAVIAVFHHAQDLPLDLLGISIVSVGTYVKAARKARRRVHPRARQREDTLAIVYGIVGDTAPGL